MKYKIPQILIVFRLLLGPIMIFLCYIIENKIRAILVVLIILGIISDIFDGIIARKLKVSSEKMRRLDSQVDVLFWLCVGWCVWVLNPKIITENHFPITLVFIMEGLTYVFSILKFGKETCTHAILSKLWDFFNDSFYLYNWF